MALRVAGLLLRKPQNLSPIGTCFFSTGSTLQAKVAVVSYILIKLVMNYFRGFPAIFYRLKIFDALICMDFVTRFCRDAASMMEVNFLKQQGVYSFLFVSEGVLTSLY